MMRRTRLPTTPTPGLLLLALCAGCWADIGPDGSSAECEGAACELALSAYERDVLPVLRENGCTECHGGSGGLFMDTEELIMTTGDDGPVIIPCDSANSIIIQKLREPVPFGDRMPRGRAPISDAHLRIIANWIDNGADQQGTCERPEPDLGVEDAGRDADADLDASGDADIVDEPDAVEEPDMDADGDADAVEEPDMDVAEEPDAVEEPDMDASGDADIVEEPDGSPDAEPDGSPDAVEADGSPGAEADGSPDALDASADPDPTDGPDASEDGAE